MDGTISTGSFINRFRHITTLNAGSAGIRMSGTSTSTDFPTNFTTVSSTFPEYKHPLSTAVSSSVFVPCRNPDNLISEQTSRMVELVVHGGIFPVLVLTGVITNILNMVIFARQGLAFADSGYLLFLMAAKAYTLMALVDREAGSFWQQRYLNTVLGVFMGFLNTSNAMTTVIAVERCICIVAPFRAKSLLKAKHMAFVIVSIYVYVLGLYGILNVKYVTVRLHNSSTGTTTYVSRLGDFYLHNKVVIDILYNYLLTISIPAISLVVVIVTTSVTIYKLRASMAWLRNGNAAVTSAERRETAVTSMLVILCCVYVICMTPSVTVAFVRNLIPDFLPTGRYCNAFKVTTALVHSLEVVNSSANFYIYLTRGSRFRATLSQCLCCTGSRVAQHVKSSGKEHSQDINSTPMPVHEGENKSDSQYTSLETLDSQL